MYSKVIQLYICLFSCFSRARLFASPPDSSVHGIFQARILEQVTTPSSRRSFWPRDWTHVSCITGRFFTTEPGEKIYMFYIYIKYIYLYTTYSLSYFSSMAYYKIKLPFYWVLTICLVYLELSVHYLSRYYQSHFTDEKTWVQRISLVCPSVSLVAQTVENMSAIFCKKPKEISVWSLGREDPPEGGNGNPLQYSCLENSMDRGVHTNVKRLMWN